jgi:preprotein translocase subunit YajC
MSTPLLSSASLIMQASPGQSPFAFFGMMIAMFAIFYFLLIRPQQKRLKDHKDMVAAVRRNDTVVTAGGLIGKVTKVNEGSDEITVQIAPEVRVKVLLATLQDVRAKNAPKPANDSASKKK